jgi:hypothetical protein
MTIEKSAVAVAMVDLYLPGEDEPRRVAVTAEAFDRLATDRPMSEVLISARPARRTTKPSATTATRADRTNYGTLEHAGTPHKGKTTDAEKQLVREHLDEINGRLAAQGLRTISVTNQEHVERYGLEQLASEHDDTAGETAAR